MKDSADIITINEAAKILGVRRSVVEEFLLDPKCPRLFVGKSQQVRFVKNQLLDYVQMRANEWLNYC